MVAFSHLSMIPFVVLAMSMVRLMINYSSLLAKNYNDNPDDDGQGGPGWTVKQEVSSLNHSRGTLSMIRGKDPNSAGSQFFISLSVMANITRRIIQLLNLYLESGLKI